METRPEYDNLEARLRASAPALPDDLRIQVLQHCRESFRRSHGITWGCRPQFVGALAGLMTLCWIATSCLDRNTQAIVNGDNTHRASSANIGHGAARIGAEGQSMLVAMRWRMREMMRMLEDQRSG